MSNAIPAGLPAEFHEDWEFISKWHANEPCSKSLPEYFARWKAALERLAAERMENGRLGNENRVELNHAYNKMDGLRALLKERMLHSWHSPNCALQYKKPCDCGLDDWCRRAQAALEGKP